MGRIPKTNDNLFPIPSGASVNSKGYVYLNVSSYWKVSSKGKKSSTHDKIAIGVVATSPGEDWKENRLMYANNNYHELRRIIETSEESGLDIRGTTHLPADSITEVGLQKVKESLQGNSSPRQPSSKRAAKGSFYIPQLEPLKRDSAIAIGIFLIVHQIVAGSGLMEILISVFGETIGFLLLNLVLYAMEMREPVYQYMLNYARDHAIFSDSAYGDQEIAELLAENVSVEQIELFKSLWAGHVLKDLGTEKRLYLCSTSMNREGYFEDPIGIEVIQEENQEEFHTRQMNIDYLIRQSDGLPVTFQTYTGSHPGIPEAHAILSSLKTTCNEKSIMHCGYKEKELSRISDADIDVMRNRVIYFYDYGSVSEHSFSELSEIHSDCFLLLRKDGIASRKLIDDYYKTVKSRRYEISRGLYGKTVYKPIFTDDTRSYYCHIIYNENLRERDEMELRRLIKGSVAVIKEYIEEETELSEEELNEWREFHSLGIEPVQDGNVPKADKSSARFRIVSCEEDYEKTDRALFQCGFYVLVSSRKMKAAEALDQYRMKLRSDIVLYQMQSFLCLENLRDYLTLSVQIRSLIWFLSSVIYTQIETATATLRTDEINRKQYSTAAVIEAIKHVSPIINLTTYQYYFAFKLNESRKKIFDCFGISENEVYRFASSLDVDINMVGMDEDD